jgi:hypothetical protein
MTHLEIKDVSCFCPISLLKYSPSYNPECNLQSMTLPAKTVKWSIGGSMANDQDKKSLEIASANSEDPNDPSSRSEAGFYEIRIKGHLNRQWSDWLEGLEMRLLDNGEMILFGHIADQAALVGVLNKLSYLNLTLISVNEVKEKD